MLGNLLSRARLPALQPRQGARNMGFNRNAINQAIRLGKDAVVQNTVEKAPVSGPALSFTPSTNPLPAPRAPKLATLSNGIRVAVTENYSPVSGLGVFVDVGSRWEDSGNNGICHFLERMSMKSTQFTTTAALVRTVSKRGANVSASASRDSMFYSAECMRQESEALLNVLRDISLYPELNDWEVQDMVEEYAAQLKEKERNPEAEIMDAIHAAAYGHSGLGLPVTAPVGHLNGFTPAVLKTFLNTHFTPDRLVLSAVGVDPDAFLASAEKLFGGLPRRADQAKVARPASGYVGGDIRSHYKDDSALTHLAIAFETANWHEADMVPMAVLQMMLGGGASFSAGGPGKGMYSRLYEKVLNRYHFAQSALSFNSIYDDTAIFGIYASSDPGHAEDLAHVVVDQALQMASAPSAVELTRAKNQLKSSVFMHLESRTMMVEDIGRQTLVYGQVHTPQQLAQRIDAVTAADIQRVARNMLRTAPSVAAVGDLSSLPRYDIIANYIKQNTPQA